VEISNDVKKINHTNLWMTNTRIDTIPSMPTYEYNLRDSVFISVTFNGNGGAMTFTNSGFSKLFIFISTCMYYNCYCNSGRGGAIYFSVSCNCEFSILRTCASRCFTFGSNSYTGQFLYLAFPNTNQNSIINQVSINQCAPLSVTGTNLGRSSSHIQYANCFIDNHNSSSNYCQLYNSIHLQPYDYAHVKYSTFFNNSASQGNMLYILTSGTGRRIDFNNSNIVGNKSPDSSTAIMFFLCSGAIKDCILYDNQNALLYSNSPSTLYIWGSVIIHNIMYLLSTGPVITTSSCIVTVKETPTYMLTHFATYFCQTLDPPIPLEITPCRTIALDPTPARTMPESPTACKAETEQAIINLNSMMQALLLSMIHVLMM